MIIRKNPFRDNRLPTVSVVLDEPEREALISNQVKKAFLSPPIYSRGKPDKEFCVKHLKSTLRLHKYSRYSHLFQKWIDEQLWIADVKFI